MGEIIFSICVGGFLSLSGLTLILVLRKEEKKLNREKTNSTVGPKADPPPRNAGGGVGP